MFHISLTHEPFYVDHGGFPNGGSGWLPAPMGCGCRNCQTERACRVPSPTLDAISVTAKGLVVCNTLQSAALPWGTSAETDLMGEQTVGIAPRPADHRAFYPICSHAQGWLTAWHMGANLMMFDDPLWSN